MTFPESRLRRLRRTPGWRALVRETRLSPEQFINPLFVRPGKGEKRPIPSMPGCFQHSVDTLVEEARDIARHGVPAVMLFGIPERKDATGTDASLRDGVVPTAVRAIKESVPELLVWTDVCLCAYTDHGHCGVLHGKEVDNDATLERLAETAGVYADAGADAVAPSDMMDGRVGAIRRALDEGGHSQVAIVSYGVKYASSFYGPFREAAESVPEFGDRRAYQMDPANAREALREVELDLEEGADMIIVKPALAYLDIVWRVKERFGVPVAAYNVSGEMAMIEAAAERGWLDRGQAIMECLLSIRRAGADVVITYFAREASRMLGD